MSVRTEWWSEPATLHRIGEMWLRVIAAGLLWVGALYVIGNTAAELGMAPAEAFQVIGFLWPFAWALSKFTPGGDS